MKPDTRFEKDNMENRYTQESRPAQSNQSTQNNQPIQNTKEIVRGFIGRNVTVMIRGKKTLSGKLEQVSNYELLLTVNHEPVLIMKHAIDYISLVATSS